MILVSAPAVAVALVPARAAAHPNNDTDVTVSAYSSTVQVSIFNYHDFPIDCQTQVDGGSALYTTVGAKSTNSTWHGGTPEGSHTVTWSCTGHGAGAKSATLEGSSSDRDSHTPNVCDIDVFGGLTTLGICPNN
jgi:hypothetical protein